jgi:hypothetical protein
MTETPTEPTVNAASKLQIDRPTDFKFHLAYEVYSKAWDENTSEAARGKLNELISSLASDENGYSDFYGQIQQYRSDFSRPTSGRMRIETGRKRQWQRNQNRDARNRRHR